MKILAIALFAALSATTLLARAAASGQAVTHLNVSVAGNESKDFSVRFLDASGHPSAGEPVTFSNDACGSFPNGYSAYTTTTDASGVATARFTAYPQGIGCYVAAVAGNASVRFNVLTYLPQYAYLTAALPARVVPGESFTFKGAAMYGVYPLYDVDVTARVVSGAATISPASTNSGQDGSITYTVASPAAPGSYQVELQFRDRVQRFTVSTGDAPWQDMWWAGPQEDGWGVSVVQHGDMLFSVIYAYDAAGAPTWYVMPGGAWNAAHAAYSGALYSPHGSPYSSYDSARFVPGNPVGTGTLDFSDPARVAMSFTIAGTGGTKALQRQSFGPATAAATAQVGDMWWGGASQNGWGLAVLQQYASLFGVWFTYDSAGSPTWLVLPAGQWIDAQTWSGSLFRTSGSSWLGQAYDKAALHTTNVGTMRLSFAAGASRLDAVVDGRSYSLPIERQPF